MYSIEDSKAPSRMELPDACGQMSQLRSFSLFCLSVASDTDEVCVGAIYFDICI